MTTRLPVDVDFPDEDGDEAGEEFRPGREGEGRDEMEEREERERNKRQGARRKTKKDGGKTYTRLEDPGEDIELTELREVVVDVKIGKSKKIPADIGEAAKECVTGFLDGIFERVRYKYILLAISELDGKDMVSSTDRGSNFYALDVNGNFEDGKEHKKLKEALGPKLTERASVLDAQMAKETRKPTTPTPREREPGQRGGEDQRVIEERLARIEAEKEEIVERMSLREKVKYYFKKYGFTVVGILTAIGAIIGSILSNLKSGLANVAKGVGKGLKDLGAKLAGILPGMIGAIAKFLFDTAGEVVGFLAEHAWVLIVGLVVLGVESFKKKYGRKK